MLKSGVIIGFSLYPEFFKADLRPLYSDFIESRTDVIGLVLVASPASLPCEGHLSFVEGGLDFYKA